MQISIYPSNLVLLLKRFQVDHNRNKQKNSIQVLYEETLQLSHHETHKTYLYSLYSVIIHEGQSSESGHYFTFSKTNKDTWLELNDERVTEVSSDRVLDNKNAYVLFYKLEKVL